MKLKSFLVMLCIVMQSHFVFAQRQADIVVPFQENIESIILNPFTGSIIVKEKNTIQSYNPETSSIEWKITKEDLVAKNVAKDLAKANDVIRNIENANLGKLMESKKDEVSFISNSPFIKLILDDNDIIVNSTNGKIAFNSKDVDYRIIQSEYMPQEKAFLLMVINNNAYSCVYYDLTSGSQKWITELSPLESFFKSIGSLFSLKVGDGEVMEERDKVVTTNSSIFTSINGDLYKIEKNDGKVSWKTDFKVTDFYLSDNQQNLITMRSAGNILSSKMALNLLNANTGEKLWKDAITTKYVTYIEDAGDKLLVAHANGFNFYSYADGKKVWKKDAKGNKIKQVIPIGDDYLYVADKEMNLIGKDGISKWKKFIEICDNDEDEVYYLGKVDNNRVFYLSDTYGNMVDYTTGKKIWKKNIEFDKKRPLLYSYDEQQNIYLVYNDKKLYKFDPNAEDKPETFAKLKEIKDDKTMSNIELFDWGVSLVGQNDVIGVTFDGETKYHNIYKEPGRNKRGWIKAGRFAGSAATGLLGLGNFANMAKGGMMGKGANSDQKAAAFVSEYGNDILASSALDKYEQRFNALKHNNEYAFVLAKNDNTGDPQLVKVRKSDGVEVDMIALEGTKPLYEVDAYNDNLYYVHKNELRVYNKK